MLNFTLLFGDLLFCLFDILYYSEVMILCHVDHVVYVLDLLVHVDWHCSDDFLYVVGSLWVVSFHLGVLLENTFRDWLDFSKFWLNFILFMLQLLILLLKMLNKWHKILHLKIKVQVRIISLLLHPRSLWDFINKLKKYTIVFQFAKLYHLAGVYCTKRPLLFQNISKLLYTNNSR